MSNPWHLCLYQLAEAAGAQTDLDMAGVADPIISRRNGHFIFSEPYDLLAVHSSAAHLTNMRANVPSWNAIGRFRVWPLEVSTNEDRINSYPRIMDLRRVPVQIPVNEEIAWEASTGAGAVTNFVANAMFIAPRGAINYNLPRGDQRIVVSGTAAITSTALNWSGPNAITFSDNLRGGWYCVNGAYVFPASVAANSTGRFFRLFFPRAYEVNGRILRPGSYITDAIGNLEYPDFNTGMGEWGRFHTFEPCQIEAWSGDALTAAVFNIRLDLTYLGTNPTY